MSKPARATAIAEWGKEKARRDEIRGRHGLPEEIPAADVQKYNCSMVDYLEKYQEKTAPAMPCVADVPDSASKSVNLTVHRKANISSYSGPQQATKGFVCAE